LINTIKVPAIPKQRVSAIATIAHKGTSIGEVVPVPPGYTFTVLSFGRLFSVVRLNSLSSTF
jgi:hypothetical protein